MARHSKWNNIKHHKAAEDKRKGKLFTKHAKLIAVAARGGADPDHNVPLRSAVDNARAERVPNENIERAIKKGSGEGKDAAIYEEIVYEAYGHGSVAMLVEVLTDNRNRTFGNLKLTVSKKGGRMAENGAVAWMFKKIGIMIVEVPEGVSVDEAELMLIDLGAADVEADGQMLQVKTSPEDLGKIRRELLEKGYKVDQSRMTYEASNKVELAEESVELVELEKLIEAIEADDDVSEVYTNLF